MYYVRSLSLMMLGSVALLPTAALAAADEAPAATLAALQVVSSGAVATRALAAAAPFAEEAMDEGSLSAIAGREDTAQVAHADQVAGVSRNSVGDNSLTGDARIDGNAFQNMSGLSILNVNTGNNVAINAAMNVNISLSATP